MESEEVRKDLDEIKEQLEELKKDVKECLILFKDFYAGYNGGGFYD